MSLAIFLRNSKSAILSIVHKGKIIQKECITGGSAESEHDSAGNAETWRAIANMTNFVQGMGILYLPYSVYKGGVATIVAFPLFALVHWYTGSITVGSMYAGKKEIARDEKQELGEGDEKLENSTVRVRLRNCYRDLGDILWPTYGGLVLDVLQNIDLLSLAISYLISCGSSMAHALPAAGLTEAAWASIFAIVVLPTTFVKDLGCVAWQSLLGLTSTFTIALILIWYAQSHASLINISDFLFWDPEGALIAFGMVLSSYCVYSILIPVEASMADPSKFNLALGISLNLGAIFKILFSLVGFLCFTRDTNEVIGNNFPLGASRTIFSILTVVFIVFSYNLTLAPVFQSLDDSRLAKFVASHISALVWTALIRCVTVSFTLLVALTVPHLALFTAFIGSLVLCILEYIVPCSVHLKLNFGALNQIQVAADLTIIVVGIIGTIFGAFFSGKALVLVMVKG